MASLAALAAGSLEATVLALLAIFLYQVHRQAGLIPFIFLMTVLAMLVPLAGHASLLTLAPGWTAPGVAATVAGAYVGLVLLTYLLTGSKNALPLAALPAGAGVLASTVAVLSGWTDLVLPAGLIPAQAGTPIIAGIALSAGAYLAIAAVKGVTRMRPETRPSLVVLPASLAGTAAQGVLMAGAVAVGLTGNGATWAGTAVASLALGWLPILLVALFIDHETSHMAPDERLALASQPIFGTESLVEAYEEAQEAYERGVLHGQEKAMPFIELLESQPVGTYICDQRGKIVYANQALGELLGQSGEDLRGKNVTHLMANVSKQGRPKPAVEALQPGTHRVSVAMPSGRQRLLEIEISGKDGRITGHVTDLTHELGRLELERQRQRTGFYVDLLSEGIIERLGHPRDLLGRISKDPTRALTMRENLTAAHERLEAIAEIVDNVQMMVAAEQSDPKPFDATDLLERAGERAQERHGEQLTIDRMGPETTVLLKGGPLLDQAFDKLVDVALERASPSSSLQLALHSRGSSGWVMTIGYVGKPPSDRFRELLAGESVPYEEDEHLGAYAVHALISALGGWVRVETGAHRGRQQEVAFAIHLPEAKVDPAAWRMMSVSERKDRALG